MAMKGLDLLQFPRKLTNVSYTCITHNIRDTVYTLCLVLTNCNASSPVGSTKSRKCLMLLSSSSPPPSVYSICHVLSFPLLRYLDENIHHAHRSVSDRLPKKCPGDKLKKEF